MLGYVKAEKAELKMREWEVYSAYYCGVCKSVGRRFGQLERMTLSYDFAFLALLLGSLSAEADSITPEHCLIHPVKKKNISASTPQIDYAGDMMLLLAYYNLLDDINDNDKGSFKDKIGAKAGEKILHRNVKKLQLKYDRICGEIESQLVLLSKLEKEKCSSLDQAAEPFAILMGEVFAGGVEDISAPGQAATLRQLGRALGKWIYLADAFDDLEEDMTSGSYNPFVCRFAAELAADIQLTFKDRIRDRATFVLMTSLSEIGKAYDLLDIKKNGGILENIIYFGLLRRTENLLSAGQIH